MEDFLLNFEINFLASKEMASIIAVGKSLAAVMVAICMIKIARDFMGGNHFDWMEFVKPLILFVIVANFNTVVIYPLRTIAGIYDAKIVEAANVNLENVIEKIREDCIRSWENSPNETPFLDPSPDDDRLIKWLKKTIKKFIDLNYVKGFIRSNTAIKYTISFIIMTLTFSFFRFMSGLMIYISVMSIMIMAIIGPFTFAISIIPQFKNGIKLWIERYIQFLLWSPMVNMVCLVGYKVIHTYYTSQTLASAVTMFSNGKDYAVTFILFALLVVLFRVPKFASFIVESAGTEAMAAGIGDGTKKAAAIAAKAVTL